MTTEQSQEQLIESWFKALRTTTGDNYKDIPEPLSHIQSSTLRWVQPNLGWTSGIIKIDYLPSVAQGYLDTISLYNFLSIFSDTATIPEISAQSVLKIIYDGIRTTLGRNTPLAVSLEYQDPFDNTIMLALSSGDFPKIIEEQESE